MTDLAIAERDETIRKLRDPVAVHVAMLRGEIAIPPLAELLHVYGATFSDLDTANVELANSCPKWAWVTGSCCDGWGLEFRNDYAWQDTPEQLQKAIEAWNTMERAGGEVAV